MMAIIVIGNKDDRNMYYFDPTAPKLILLLFTPVLPLFCPNERQISDKGEIIDILIYLNEKVHTACCLLFSCLLYLTGSL